MALELNKGLFAGISLQGSFVNSDSGADRTYYGQSVGPDDIVIAMRVNNPGDDPLRSVLTRLGSPAGIADLNAPSPPGYRGGGNAGYGGGNGYAGPSGGPMPIAPNGSVEQQDLPPPHR